MKMFLTRLGFGSKMVVTGDITQVDLPRDQKSGLIVVNDILTGVEGIEFIRFGGEDVVRHKLVQRIVAAYDEHSQRAAPELRPAQQPQATTSQVVLEVEVIGSSDLPEESLRRLVAIALASAGVDDGHVAVEFVDAERIAALNAEHRGIDGPDRRALVPGRPRRAGGRPARARRRRDLPGAHRGPLRGGRPRHAAPRGDGPRDRPRRDARAAGGDRLVGEDDPLGLHRARRPAERRQVDAGQRARRPEGGDRLRQAADHPPRDPRRGDPARRVAARAHRPAGRPAPARRADRAHAAPRRARVRGGRRRAARAQRRAGRRRRRRPLHRRGAAQAPASPR